MAIIAWFRRVAPSGARPFAWKAEGQEEVEVVARIPKPLVLVTEPHVSQDGLDRVVPAAVRGGVSHVLLRMPGPSHAPLLKPATIQLVIEPSAIMLPSGVTSL